MGVMGLGEFRKPYDTETPFDAFHLLRAGGDAGTRGKSGNR